MKTRTCFKLALVIAGVMPSGLPAVGDIHYVSPSGAHSPPFTNWPGAATNIQAAIDATVDGDTVLVTNGVYDAGGVVIYGSVTNRIAVTNAVTVRSVNGPAGTVILGAGPAGETAVRCAYIGDNALLEGFTLSNGHTRIYSPMVLPPTEDSVGGGAWCATSGRVFNCAISGNAAEYGGGAYDGTLLNCTITGNVAFNGGGMYRGTAQNCVIAYNSAGAFGGGAYICTVQNCTIFGNHSAHYSGGTRACIVQNCIVYHNTATDDGDNYLTAANYEYSCTTPDPGGAGNITNAPQFADMHTSDVRLLPASPCIDAGTNLAWMAGLADLDGHPRIINETVDMGAYESPSPAITGLAPPTRSVGSVITWTSFSNAQYAVYGSSNLVCGYDLLLQDGIPAVPPENTYTDTMEGVELRGYAVEFRP